MSVFGHVCKFAASFGVVTLPVVAKCSLINWTKYAFNLSKGSETQRMCSQIFDDVV